MEGIPHIIIVLISSPFDHIRGGCRRIGDSCQSWLDSIIGILTQSGWEDLRTATVVTVGLLGPLWLLLVGTHEFGLGGVEGVMCGNWWHGVGLAPVIAVVLRFTMVLFLVKFLVRSMVTLAYAGSQTPDIKNPAFSLAGALLPAITTGVLRVGDSSIAVCLYP